MPQEPWSIANLAGPRFRVLVIITCFTAVLTAIYAAVAIGRQEVSDIVIAVLWALITAGHATLLVRATRHRRQTRRRTGNR